MALDRRRADSFGSTATYSSTSGHPSPTVASIGKPYYSNLADPPQLQPSSPTSHSTSTFLGRRDPAMPYLQSPSQLQFATDVSRRGLSIRSNASDGSKGHLSSTSAAGLLQDRDVLRNSASSSPLTTMTKTNHESCKSSNSSPISSAVSASATNPSSHHNSLNSDQRCLRALPPPFSSALKSLEYQGSFGSGPSPSNAQPTTYLRRSFSPSSSSGR